MKRLFTIRNLKCQYPGASKPVLEIDAFDVFKGELIFFLGASGVGKSTLIESLGLMNQTVAKDPRTELTYHSSRGNYALLDLWEGDPKELAQFRSKEYSFIFQRTNLFEKVSLQSNAILPSLADVDAFSQVRLRSKALAQQLLQNVTDSDFEFKNAGALSGGQKQRLAFIQAIISPHEVLFGDEPTGNLDWGNAQKVMNTLKAHIASEERTGLIVSHDINLSLAFADRIVLMTGRSTSADGQEQIGQILEENVFAREAGAWKSSNGTITHGALSDKLKSHFEETAA